VPDVSLGTHFFNELVEADILYFAMFPDRDGNILNSAFLDQANNRLVELLPQESRWSQAVCVVDASDSENDRRWLLNANTLTQDVVCYREAR